MSTTAPDLEFQSIRFGNAFEALFSGARSAMRERPGECSTCKGSLDPLTAAFILSELPVARVYRIVGAYDRPGCLPERFARLGDRWHADRWISVNEDTGEEIFAHPLAVRVLDAVDEAIMLLAPSQRDDRDILATLRGYFESDTAALLEAPWARVMDSTTLTFESGHTVSLASLFSGHRAHYDSNAGSSDPALTPYPSASERLRCFFEESAMTPEVA